MKAFGALLLLFLACTVFPLQLLVSDSQIGGEIYVLAYYENGTLFEGKGNAVNPSGETAVFAISNGQAKLNASEVGEWKVEVEGVAKEAQVADEEAKAGRGGKEGEGHGEPFIRSSQRRVSSGSHMGCNSQRSYRRGAEPVV